MNIVVIGGGISGLVASIFAKNKNNRVTILERNNICGKKILSTGNGKCNYSNIDLDIKHYQSSINIDKIINEKNIQNMFTFLDEIGIVPKIKNGYYYPYSNQATSFRNALISAALNKQVSIINDILVEEIKYDNKFIIKTNKQDIIADKVILATGSKAFPKSGSDGIGYDILKKLGHNIIKPLPALVPLITKNNVKELSGVRSEVSLKLYINNKFIKEEIGELQFTDYGISGIVAMQLSGLISSNLDKKNKVNIKVNFVYSIARNKEEFKNFMDFRKQKLTDVLDSILNYKISNTILKNIKKEYWYLLTNEEKDYITNSVIMYDLEIIDTKSFDVSQTCIGGLSLNDVNLETLESLIIPKLYIAGEILDVLGDCGGYNITFSIITGMIAGVNVCLE